MENDKAEKLQKGRVSPNRKEAKSPEMKQNSSLGNIKSRGQLKKTTTKGDEDSDETEKARVNDEPQSPSKGKATPNAAASQAKDKPPPRKKKRMPEATGALSQDFASFDILWFDLTTKTRALVTELCQPVVDKVHEHKDLLNRIIKYNEENYQKVDALENIVYDKTKKLDVFEQIYERISQVEADRKVVEQRLENNDEMIMRTFEDFRFKMENHDKILKTMV